MEKLFTNNELKPDELPRRLCSEIQLFDLCNLSACRFKDGRFCSNPELLARFEKIADREPRAPERYIDQELEEGADGDEDGYDYDREDEQGDFQDDDWEEE